MGMSLRALDTPDVVDYFSYPQHGQQMREKHFRGIWSQKLKAQETQKFRDAHAD